MVADSTMSATKSSKAINSRLQNKMSNSSKEENTKIRNTPQNKANRMELGKLEPNTVKGSSSNHIISNQATKESNIAEWISNFFKPATLIVPSKFKQNKHLV